MVARHDRVIATLVVVAEVGFVRMQVSDNLGCALGAAEVHIVVIDNLTSLVDIEHRDTDCLVGSNTLLWTRSLAQSVDCLGSDLRLLATRTHLSHLFFSAHIVLVQLGAPLIQITHST